MGGGAVWVVGDSMNEAFWQSASAALGLCRSRNSVQCGGGERVRLRYVRSDQLSLATKPYATRGVHNMRHVPWFQRFVRDTSAHTLVVNRGAHYEPTPVLLEAVKAVLDAVTRDRPDVLLVVRDTPSGHPGCGKPAVRNGPPVTSPLSYAGMPYHWDEFPSQNEAVRGLVGGYVNAVFWDVSAVTSQRADSHLVGPKNDCLHYCAPGPVDTWVEQLGRLLWAAGSLRARPPK